VQASGSDVARVLSSQVREHRVDAVVEARDRAMVVIAQAFYPPWRAFIDGTPTPLWRANHAFQALEVPSGRHHVSIVYRDQAFRVGALISLLALALCIAAYWILRRSNHPTPGYDGC
jgi:uncharacterized membrane protein YfhO